MSSRLFHYIVFMPDNTQITNSKLAEFWDSFGIQRGNLNTASWNGKIGACKVKHENYNGEPSAKVSYFLKKKDQETLSPWQEPSGIASVTYAPKDVYKRQNIYCVRNLIQPLPCPGRICQGRGICLLGIVHQRYKSY